MVTKTKCPISPRVLTRKDSSRVEGLRRPGPWCESLGDVTFTPLCPFKGLITLPLSYHCTRGQEGRGEVTGRVGRGTHTGRVLTDPCSLRWYSGRMSVQSEVGVGRPFVWRGKDGMDRQQDLSLVTRSSHSRSAEVWNHQRDFCTVPSASSVPTGVTVGEKEDEVSSGCFSVWGVDDLFVSDPRGDKVCDTTRSSLSCCCWFFFFFLFSVTRSYTVG